MNKDMSDGGKSVPNNEDSHHKTVLIVASVASMIEQFNMPNINILQNMGYQVEVACNFKKGNTITRERIQEFRKYLDKNQIPYHQIDFERNAMNLLKNIKAYKQLKQLLDSGNTYEFIHCHSPVGGAIGRLAGYAAGTKVIYTAHGFHFYKGAPLWNWLIYYSIEKYLSHYTNLLITINKEDFGAAKNFLTGHVEYIPGIGIDTAKYQAVINDEEKEEKRRCLGIFKEDIVLLSVGELNKNKNHQIVIRAISELKNLPIKYLICGQGKRYLKLKRLTERLKLQDKVLFLGYRTDVKELFEISDIFIFPSKREGLSVSLMEAMASGKPVICSKIRGNVDLIDENKNGILCSKYKEYVKAIHILSTDKNLCRKYAENSLKKIEKFSIEIVSKKMEKIYKEII